MTRKGLLMKFGITNLFADTGSKTQAQVFDETLAEIEFAEELGFDSVWLAEHHLSEYGMLGSPLMFAAAIAQRTNQIRIGTAVLVLPFYHPLRLAEDVAVVDILSKGRLDLGWGRGYQPLEFSGLGFAQEEAKGRAEECVEIMKLAWTQERFSYHGKFYHFDNVSVYPKPVQDPHPPLWRAAVSPPTFEAAGAAGEPILTSPSFSSLAAIKEQFDTYTAALAAVGHKPSDFDLPLMQRVYVGSDEREAYETPKPHLLWYYRTLSGLLTDGAIDESKGFDGWAKRAAKIKGVEYDDLYNKAVNFGSSEQVIDQIKVLESEIGVTHYICWFNIGGLPHEKVMASIERFAKEVIPEFAASPATEEPVGAA
jgi:alkanesulfonate monooxygenase SsuD/methylene tetrahydromethanopterin reductase-like flavin-dependent oxidoreductase (luciferase family)